MAMATSAAMESQTMIQTEARVQRFQETKSETRTVSERTVKKKKSMRRHKDEGTISVSKSSEKLHKKMKASEPESNPQCCKCARPVFAMERVKAERQVFHKECFRCVQCNKQLTVETYQSDHTTLYCKPHFKQLFEPKPVDGDDETDATPKRHQMIICESNPIELPPDVVRASDKPDLGLQELSQLDVKSRFEVFEKKKQEEPAPLEPRTKRETSTALLSKLAKFKAKGMDVGVSDEFLNGVPIEASSSEHEEEEDDEDSVLKKSYKHTTNKEQPVSFCNMSEIVGKFESGQHAATERHRERKQEIQNIRSRLFMGKQAKIKEMYEQSVMQSEQGVTSSDKIACELELDTDKARAIKQRFENGEVFNDENQPPKAKDIDDRALFNDGTGEPKSKSIKERFESGEIYNDDKHERLREQRAQIDEEKARTIKERFETGEVYRDEKEMPKQKDVEMETLHREGIGKKSRSIFLELDANAATAPLTPPANEPPRRKEIPFVPKDVIRSDDKVEDVKIETADITDRFKFFETYKPDTKRKEFRMTPPRQQRPKSPSPELYHDPSVTRSAEAPVDISSAAERHTASRMINVFRNMEDQLARPSQPGPKPLKCFTPPPPGESNHRGDSSEEEYTSEEEEDSEDERRRQYLEARERDDALKQAQQLARTKSFRDRFENWSESEPQRSPSTVVIERQYDVDDGESQVETAKSLREKFENLQVTQSSVTKTLNAPKVNRFV